MCIVPAAVGPRSTGRLRERNPAGAAAAHPTSSRHDTPRLASTQQRAADGEDVTTSRSATARTTLSRRVSGRDPQRQGQFRRRARRTTMPRVRAHDRTQAIDKAIPSRMSASLTMSWPIPGRRGSSSAAPRRSPLPRRSHRPAPDASAPAPRAGRDPCRSADDTRREGHPGSCASDAPSPNHIRAGTSATAASVVMVPATPT